LNDEWLHRECHCFGLDFAVLASIMTSSTLNFRGGPRVARFAAGFLLAFNFLASDPAISFGGPKQDALMVDIGTKGDALVFDTETIRAKAGQAIELKFTNRSNAAAQMQHNWVLVKPGTDQEVAAAGVRAGKSKEYVPDSPDVIAHTHLLDAGKSESISFQAPAQPGKYPYLCSFPGHSQSLRGTLIVEK